MNVSSLFENIVQPVFTSHLNLLFSYDSVWGTSFNHSYSKIDIWTRLIRRLLQHQHSGFRAICAINLWIWISTGTTPAFGLGQPAAVTVAPAFGAASTAANGFGFGQSAVVPALGAAQQPATTPSFPLCQQQLQQHHRFH